MKQLHSCVGENIWSQLNLQANTNTKVGQLETHKLYAIKKKNLTCFYWIALVLLPPSQSLCPPLGCGLSCCAESYPRNRQDKHGQVQVKKDNNIPPAVKITMQKKTDKKKMTHLPQPLLQMNQAIAWHSPPSQSALKLCITKPGLVSFYAASKPFDVPCRSNQ